jgi:hypothetical protein
MLALSEPEDFLTFHIHFTEDSSAMKILFPLSYLVMPVIQIAP